MLTWLIVGWLAAAPFHAQHNAAEKQQRHTNYAPEVAIAFYSQPAAEPPQDSTDSKQAEPLCKRLFDALIAQWPLIVIGVPGVWAALKTLNAIKRQSDIFISKERARLQFEPGTIAIAPLSDPIPINGVGYRVRCHGTTPATIIETRAWAQISDSQDWYHGDEYLGLPIPSVLVPSLDGIQGNIPLSFSDRLILDQIDIGERVRNRQLFVHIYGYLRYKDIFGGKWKYPFRYVWLVGLYGGQWIRSAEEGDNVEAKDTSNPN